MESRKLKVRFPKRNSKFQSGGIITVNIYCITPRIDHIDSEDGGLQTGFAPFSPWMSRIPTQYVRRAEFHPQQTTLCKQVLSLAHVTVLQP